METIGYAEHKEKDEEYQKISLEIDDFAKIFRIYMDEYDVFRKYLTREEDLINQRLGWILLCEGFLFGANAAVTKFLFDMIQNPSVQHKNVYITLCLLILLSMSILGCLAAFWCLKSVRAAHNAMKKLFKLWGIRQANWKKIFSGMNIKHCSRLSSFDFELPFVGGGGDKKNIDAGLKLSEQIPNALIMSWAFWAVTSTIGVILALTCNSYN